MRHALVVASSLVLAGAFGAACKKDSTQKPAGLTASGATPPSVPPPPPMPSAAPAGGAEVVEGPPDPAESVSGTITLPKARKGDVARGDTIYIIARRAGGAPGPGSMLAVQKLQVDTFPMPFALSGRDAMIPGTRFEGSISISVRVDKDGDAITRKKGDVIGQANDVKVGSHDVTIPLDTVLTEDQPMGGMRPGAMPGGPAGMPPGHP